jgi:hypothetical protein
MPLWQVNVVPLTGSARYIFRRVLVAFALCGLYLLCAGCSGGSGGGDGDVITVNSLADTAQPPAGTVTLRSALATVADGGSIVFAPGLDGGEILLSAVATDHATLKGEVFIMNQERRWVFQGYQERDYGRTALYVRKSVAIDASALPNGITLRWTGGDADRARVLAVYGDLTLKNVTITGGYAGNEPLASGSQPYTLARGGGIAVWGAATLERCTIHGNRVSGDITPSRDRGAFGGGIYANIIRMTDSIVAGNSAVGFGAAGGGFYSVGGGALSLQDSRYSSISGSAVTGNSVTAQHAYGGGIYSDGGGPGNSRTIDIRNCTIARNRVRDNPDIAESAMFQYYYRGGGIYMSNGSLSLTACTVAENSVTGVAARFSDRPNMGGGGIAATIGDAHVVENMRVRHSIIVGNSLAGAADDLYTGSLIHFFSYGHNLVGKLDFSQILVPIPPYLSLNRRHWPAIGDMHGVQLAGALDVASLRRHASIVSVGTDEGEHAVLWYPPGAAAADTIPVSSNVVITYAQYTVVSGGTDDFLNHLLERIRSLYGGVLGNDFGSDLGDLSGITCNAASTTWPSDQANVPWIHFWRDIDQRIGNLLGPQQLGEAFWRSFSSGPLGANIVMSVDTTAPIAVTLSSRDQRGNARPYGGLGDIGAIEAYP